MMFSIIFKDDFLDTAIINKRIAVRAIIFNHDKLLMVKNKYGDVKFPGGGINPFETTEEALRREVKEETGYINFTIIELLGNTIQYQKDIYEDNAIFVMESLYYLCRLDDDRTIDVQLDDYEEVLEFKSGFYSIKQAIENNQQLLAQDKTPFKWVKRETAVLQKLSELEISTKLIKQ